MAQATSPHSLDLRVKASALKRESFAYSLFLPSSRQLRFDGLWDPARTAMGHSFLPTAPSGGLLNAALLTSPRYNREAPTVIAITT